MHVAVVGQGSIGKRHSENLINLGHKVVPLDIGDELDFNIDCAFICTPTQLHCEQAWEYLSRGIPTFIEKPLGSNLRELQDLWEKVKDKNVISMVGCNLRFHPAVRDAKDVVAKHKVIFARAEYGYYLPFWRRGDYTKSYSASQHGGIILDDIHEIDYLYWLFGEISELKIVYGKVSDLEIKQEDIAETSILFQNGVSASVHQDYLCKNYHRELTLHLGHERVTFRIPPTNLAFKKEVEYFINCVERNVQPMNNVMEAIDVLSKILEAKNGSNYTSETYLNETPTESFKEDKRKNNTTTCDRQGKESYTRR